MPISEQIILEASNRASAAFRQLAADAKSATGEIQAGLKGMKGDLQTSGLMLGGTGAGMTALAVSSTMLAARVQTLGAVMHVVGGTAGYTAEQMDAFEAGVKKMGITTQASRESLIKLAQANIDLSQATTLARIAQDAAVIGGINSSEAFDRMIHGITTLNPLILRHMGLLVNLEQEYSAYAAANGVTVESLDGMTKQQVMVNAVMQAGSRIAGSYESAMGTAGKQITSLSRYTEEASLAMGEAFLPLMSDAIMALTDLLKAFNSLSPAQKAFAGELVGIGGAALTAAGGILIFASKLPGLLSMLSNLGTGVAQLSMALPGVTSATAPVTNALLGMQSTAAAGAITLGIYTVAITAVVVALYKLYEAHKVVEAGVQQTTDAWGVFFNQQIEEGKSATQVADAYIAKQQQVNQVIQDGGIIAQVVIGGNEKVTGSWEGISATLAKTADSYREYREAMTRVAEANGYVVDASGNLVEVMDSEWGAVERVVQANYLLSDAMFGGTSATTGQIMALTGATEATSTYTKNLYQAYPALALMVQQQEAANQAYYEEASAQQTAANAAAVADQQRLARLGVLEQLKNQEQQLTQAEAQWSKTVGQDAANALQQAGVKGEKYREALSAIDAVMGTNLGMQQDYRTALLNLAKDFASGKINSEEFKTKLAGLKDAFKPLEEGIGAAMTKIGELQKQYDALKGQRVDMYIDVWYQYHGNPPGGSGPGGGAGGGDSGGGGHEWYQHGGQFKVAGPGGIDRVPVRFMATAGETVTITPAGEGAPGAGGGAANYTYVNNFNDAGSARIALEQQRRDRIARAESLM